MPDGKAQPVLLEDHGEFTGDFHDLRIEIRTNPTGEVLITYKFKIKTDYGKVLVPIAGFKSEFRHIIDPVPLPISVKVQEVELEIIHILVNHLDEKSIAYRIYKLANGNKGVYLELPSMVREYDVVLSCLLKNFLRSDPLGTELIIGIFPPWGWSSGHASINFEGILAPATRGHKFVAGLHDISTGQRIGKYKPSSVLYRARRRGDLLTWNLNLESLKQGQELRFRARAARLPLIVMINPLALSWILIFLLFFILTIWREVIDLIVKYLIIFFKYLINQIFK